MNSFDTKGEIKKIGALLSQWETSDRTVRRYRANPEKMTAEAIASAKRSVMVFLSDLHAELGGPVAGSSAFVLCTEENEAVCDNEVILVGDDIPEMTEGTSAFAQVIMVSGSGLDDGEYYKITKYPTPGGLADGFMVKSTQENIWCRVSKTAVESGLRFEKLGHRLIEMIKFDCPFVEKASVLYIVSSPEDIECLKPIESKAITARKEIRSKIWKERGVDLLTCSQWGHCGKCTNKTICDEVRRIQSAYSSE